MATWAQSSIGIGAASTAYRAGLGNGTLAETHRLPLYLESWFSREIGGVVSAFENTECGAFMD
jgi:hypothetical protein